MPLCRTRKPTESDGMIYITPPPRCAYGEFRLSGRYSPTLKGKDYKDPIWIIETEDDDTIQPDARWNMQND